MDITKATLPKHPAFSLTRTIHPVGQGAFYSETFKDLETNQPLLTAVYDCGGKEDTLKKEIDSIEELNIVFISHFHSDHINGLETLIDLKKPKMVVVPRISPSRFLVDFVSNCLKDKSGVANQLMLTALPSMKPENNYAHIDNNTTYSSVLGESHISKDKSIWEYIAYYNEEDSADKRLAEDLVSLLGLTGYDSESYFEPTVYQGIAMRLINGKDLIEKIKEVYEQVFDGKHNSYSMLVLSHEINGENIRYNSFDCLYTGDIKPDEYVLSIVSNNSPDFIQVPHHGSNHNHNNHLYSKDRIAFMSVGETNKYRHPGLKTLLYLYDNCKEIHVVTEKRNYKK